ncbi:hypothetical protein [uncultured Aquimarina sp.]|uniref:hypothetical protein n=1 Tax=uncultured Aquimarina sp. TaxID=575652 RepID=UPI002633FC09|nr:hypothetical protein [uncultured Aquimarina sp.]
MEEQYNDIKKLVKEAGVEHPSVDFLQNIMGEIKTTSVNKSLVYQPLISKKAWVVISSVVIGILVSLPFLSEETSILGTLDLSFFSINEYKNPFADFKFHNTTMYGIIFLAILFMVQITVIKRRIDKIYSV